MRSIGVALVMVLAGLASLVSCSTASDVTAKAVATMEPRSDSEARGVVTFTEKRDGTVEVRVDLENVPPGTHGFHVHETGDCSAPDAASAGGHFNPFGTPHAGPGSPNKHLGDLGNVTAGSDGGVSRTIRSKVLTVNAGDRSVVGKAVVLHAGADDLMSQPSGAAGGRIACGVINWVPISK